MITTPPAIAAAPTSDQARDRDVDADRRSRRSPATMARRPRPTQRATTLLGFSTIQPRLTTWLSRLGRSPTPRAELGQVVGLDEVLRTVPSARNSVRATASAGPIGRRALRARCASSTASPAAGSVSMPTLVDSPSRPLSSRNAIRPRDARSSIAVVKARRDGRAVHHERARRRGQVGRRRRHEDRRVVEVDRVLAEAPPGEERPAGQAQEDDRRDEQAQDGVDLAAELEPRRRAPASRPRRSVHRDDAGRRRGPRPAGTGPCPRRRCAGAARWSGTSPRSRARRTAGPGRARRDGSRSKNTTIPSSNPRRPMPHWSMSAMARASVSSVVTP